MKQEPVSMEDLHTLYEKVKEFTPACLDALAEILDPSDTWKNLAELLDLGHLLRSGLYESNNSPTKMLLRLAIEVIINNAINCCCFDLEGT